MSEKAVLTYPKAAFLELWKKSTRLGCPLTRGHAEKGATWLFPFPQDPCKDKVCKFITCHSYGESWSKYEELIVPDVALTREEILDVEGFLESDRIFALLESHESTPEAKP